MESGSLRLGVKVNPHILATLFKADVRIQGDGFSIRLTDNGIPANLELIHSGQDPETREFYFVFGVKGDRVTGPVIWLTPTYEKEAGHGANP